MDVNQKMKTTTYTHIYIYKHIIYNTKNIYSFIRKYTYIINIINVKLCINAIYHISVHVNDVNS